MREQAISLPFKGTLTTMEFINLGKGRKKNEIFKGV